MFGVARECEYICLVPIPSDPNYIRFIIIHAYNHDQLFCQCCPSLVVFDPFHFDVCLFLPHLIEQLTLGTFNFDLVRGALQHIVSPSSRLRLFGDLVYLCEIKR